MKRAGWQKIDGDTYRFKSSNDACRVLRLAQAWLVVIEWQRGKPLHTDVEFTEQRPTLEEAQERGEELWRLVTK